MTHEQTRDERIVAIAAQRDKKAHDHLSQYAPIWLLGEKPLPEEDSVQFEVVFLHPLYGWVKRRYYYDAFQDTLYHKGQIAFDEEKALELDPSDAFLKPSIVNPIESYGG